jgi:oligoendopeptidase F
METVFQSTEQWAEYVLERWRRQITKLRVKNTEDLSNSLAKQVVSASGGDVQKVLFFYNYYGKMVDMGVGKGIKLGDVKENTLSRRLEGRRNGNRRRAKKWYSVVFYSQTVRLGEIMQKTYGKKAIATVVENLPSFIKMEL